ncbi:MAG: ABC transporter permease, partial [Anaerolineae bacterium]|nr:ABC transporter permease [Anaerolineae bacterium]
MTVQSEAIALPVVEKKQRSLWGDVWIQFRKHKLAMFGLFVISFIVISVLIGPLVYTKDPEYIDFSVANQAPSLQHPFGTDNLGRDGLARNLFGGRISIAVGIVAMLISMFVGSLVGAMSGYYPKLDGPLMRFTDMMLALPLLPLLLVIILLFRDSLRATFGPETGIFLLIVFVIGILNWMPTARVVRGSVLSIKEKEFVEAAISIGTNQNAVLFKHVFPNVLSPIIVAATLSIANAIITESALSFLGLGFPSDVPTWGRLLYDGKDFMTFTPWVVIFPGLFISFTVLGINFMGDGLRDA